jgi:hypothetical protein
MSWVFRAGDGRSWLGIKTVPSAKRELNDQSFGRRSLYHPPSSPQSRWVVSIETPLIDRIFFLLFPSPHDGYSTHATPHSNRANHLPVLLLLPVSTDPLIIRDKGVGLPFSR